MIDILKNTQKQIADTIPELQYVDEDWGQIDYYSTNMPVKWPLALIDITDANFSNLGMDRTKTPIQRQIGKIFISITIANLKLTNTSYRAPQQQKDDAWKIWEVIGRIHEELHGWNPTLMAGKLIRESFNRVKRDDGVQEYKIVFSTTLKDT
ncbi:hypothetical protein [Aquimarina algiphila]|uniref:hypothetical protein n=1 Tax=Aquimarina algiphila TaxID=2047982 RepID=UPI00232BFE72|nr:hypothetical protein [Aquimarina algiphila]